MNTINQFTELFELSIISSETFYLLKEKGILDELSNKQIDQLHEVYLDMLIDMPEMQDQFLPIINDLEFIQSILIKEESF